MGVSNFWGYPNSWMVYKGKSNESGWFRGTPIYGNPHIMFLKNVGNLWKFHSLKARHQFTEVIPSWITHDFRASLGGRSAAFLAMAGISRTHVTRGIQRDPKYPLVNVNKKLWKDPPFFMGKSTISIAIFNSKLLVITRGYQKKCTLLNLP